VSVAHLVHQRELGRDGGDCASWSSQPIRRANQAVNPAPLARPGAREGVAVRRGRGTRPENPPSNGLCALVAMHLPADVPELHPARPPPRCDGQEADGEDWPN
jgi:hypothetical protein